MFSKNVDHDEKLYIYAKNRFLGKAIFGIDRQLFESENINLRIRINARLDDCWVLVSGMKHHMLEKIENGQYAYFLRSPEIDRQVHELMESSGYVGEFLYVDPLQEICMLFSPKTDSPSLSPSGFAKAVQEIVQETLEKDIPRDQLCSQTVLGGHAQCFEDIPRLFKSASDIHDRCFFDMIPRVIDAASISNTGYLTHTEVSELVSKIISSLEKGVTDELSLHQLFRVRLKQAQRFDLLRTALTELHQRLLEFHDAFDFPDDFDDSIFDYANALTIEKLSESITEYVRWYAGKIAESHLHLSPITRDALIYLRNHYQEHLRVEDVAAYTHVSVSHLSHLFNREVGMSIPEFLCDWRLNHAKKILCETDVSVSDVAASVGFSSVGYFRTFFRKTTGLKPQEFRKAYTLRHARDTDERSDATIYKKLSANPE